MSRIVTCVAEMPTADEYGIKPDPLPPPPVRLTVRTPEEILGMEFDDSDNLLGDRLFAKGQSLTILGAGGIGKSRILLQLAVSCITGRDFIGLRARGEGLRWLILQGENSNRRLKFDLEKLKAWIGADWERVNENLVIHTLENDEDNFLHLENAENFTRLSDLISEHKPDVVCFDTLNCFGVGDLNKDADMRETCRLLSSLVKRGNPDRATVVLHHALTGKAGASKATGYDRASFGRNSKVLQAWTRGQINIAAGSSGNNETLIISCGKCSNGREFEPFAIRMDPVSMIYETDPDFDLTGWQSDVAGTRSEGPIITFEMVANLCGGGASKKELAKTIMDETGCGKSLAYSKIKQAETAKRIHLNPISKKYVKP